MREEKALDERNRRLKALPSLDEVLLTEMAAGIGAAAGRRVATRLARESVDALRSELASSDEAERDKHELLARALEELGRRWRIQQRRGLRRVVNATGVIIHTNLGRAPLSKEALDAINETAAGYSTLEFDLESGRRGKRGARVEEMINELTGAEGSLVVNNCAAAAYFVLNVFASGREVIVSRGELVEIGGDFRVPDVLSNSGAVLREVGTTNRTKLSDYEAAISEQTAMIAAVHTSNYRIIGFTAKPAAGEIAALAHRNGIIAFEDAGSGVLDDPALDLIADEPVIRRSITAGMDVVTFSGDKLLGGPQSGIVAGRREFIDRLKKHPLYRVLRPDKLTYAALEATLSAHLRGSAANEIPVLQMLSASFEQLSQRAEAFKARVDSAAGGTGDLMLEIATGTSMVGGGAAPAAEPATALIIVSHRSRSARELEEALRQRSTPVIARISEGHLVLDLRTVPDREETELVDAILSLR
jgi:L-seryl-tRNA(Ser) seleniumtransferase